MFFGIDPLRQQAAVRGVAVLHRRRERVLRREPVVGNQRPRAQRAAQPAGQRRVRVGKAERERSAVQVEDHALDARLRRHDPLAGHAADHRRAALERRGNPELARVQLLVVAPQRDDVVVVGERAAERDAQQRVQRLAAQAGLDLDLAVVGGAAMHGNGRRGGPNPGSTRFHRQGSPRPIVALRGAGFRAPRGERRRQRRLGGGVRARRREAPHDAMARHPRSRRRAPAGGRLRFRSSAARALAATHRPARCRRPSRTGAPARRRGGADGALRRTCPTRCISHASRRDVRAKRRRAGVPGDRRGGAPAPRAPPAARPLPRGVGGTTPPRPRPDAARDAAGGRRRTSR